MINLKKFFKKIFQPSKTGDKKYLDKLISNLEGVKNSDSKIQFKIQEIKPKGFLIKSGGLFGFVSFGHMPWHYQSSQHWKIISPYLVGHIFYCSIYHLSTDPISLIVDGKVHKFRDIVLEEFIPYDAIILQKTKYGLFLELGHNFDWKYGSLIGLAHISTFIELKDFENYKNGDTLTTHFLGYTNDNKILLGDRLAVREWITDELALLIGSIQEVIVRKTELNKNEFHVKEKYFGSLTITKPLYLDRTLKAKLIRKNFRNNDIVFCEIIGVNNRKKTVQLKFTNEFIDGVQLA